MQRAGWVLTGAGVAVAVAAAVLLKAARSGPDEPAPVRAEEPAPAAPGLQASGFRLQTPEPARSTSARLADAPKPEVRSPKPEADLPAASDLLAGVRSSGPAHEIWEDQARQLLGSLATGDTEATYAGCYVAGCAATVMFPTRAAYDAAVEDIASGSAFRGWTGGKRWSRPETAPSGQTSAALVLYRPD